MLDFRGKTVSYFSLGAFLCFTAGCGLSAGPRFPVYKTPSRIIEEDRSPVQGAVKILEKTEPALLRHTELVALSRNPSPQTPRLKKKIETLFNTAFVHNESRHPKPFRVYPKLGECLRIVSWNIEQSLHVKEFEEALKSEATYLSLKEMSLNRDHQKALFERELMRAADIVILQEMDIGHPRSHYLKTPEVLAKAWGMNYAYGIQYLEVDPAYLGVDDDHLKNKDALQSVVAIRPGDEHKYHGAFGNAVLSRYPIKRAEITPLQSINYDWYTEEAKSFDAVEYSRRLGSKVLFDQRPYRELKIGSRSYLRVDLHIPELPLETLSIINVHFEIKMSVKERRQQLEEVLAQIKEIKNPVVLAGDFNSSSFSAKPTSFPRLVNRTLTSPSNLLSVATPFVEGEFLGFRNTFNYVKNYTDPLAGHVPVLLENKQRGTFRTIRNFRFSDGGAFDFRGDKDHSWSRKGVLSNSNQRDSKGFVSTFRVNRPLGPVGFEKLDWIFVKSFLRSPNDARGSRRLAPHYAQTLKEFNRAGSMKFSDHDPITVLLPLREPESK